MNSFQTGNIKHTLPCWVTSLCQNVMILIKLLDKISEMIPSVVAKTLDLVTSREGSTRLVEGICKTLRIDCSKPLAYFTGTMNINQLNFGDYFDIAYLVILGPNCCLNSTLLNSLLDHGLQSTATKNLIHLSQSEYPYLYCWCDSFEDNFLGY